MSFFEVRSEFFVPVWRRVVACVAVIGWALFEAVSGGVVWATLFGAAGLWLVYSFFVAWRPPETEDEDA